MSYLSLPFALFVGITAIVYYILPQKVKPVPLLLASLVFYALFDWRCLFHLL